jgi:hypothetical protein
MATKSIKDGEQLVKRKEVEALLANFARLADKAMTLKVAEMKSDIVAELRAEIAEVAP